MIRKVLSRVYAALEVRKATTFLGVLSFLVLLNSHPAYAGTGPLTDLQAKLVSWFQVGSTVLTAVAAGAAPVSIGFVGVRKLIAKLGGDEEGMSRAGNGLGDVLKWCAIIGGMGLLATLGLEVLK